MPPSDSYIVADYNDAVKKEEYKLSAKIIDIYYNKGRNKYYLIFLSRNDRARGIVEYIYTKMKTKGTLFSALSHKEKRKMFQGKFDL